MPPAAGDSVRNGYVFVKRNDTQEDAFVHQTAIKKNRRKYLPSVGDGATVEFDVVEEKRVGRQQMSQARWGSSSGQ